MIVVCGQAWRGIKQETAVAINKGCHEVGLRKQDLGHHKSWYFWHFKLLLWFWTLHSIDVGSAY